jgi:CubicO group peptidase (beta-lactamase class C family)
VVWARGYGLKEAGKPARIDTTTLFLAGSISKPVFATGLLALVEQGRLTLDADVNMLLTSWRLPESRFTEREKVTLRRLLSHSAGLTVWGFPGYAAGAPIPTIFQVLDGAPPANTRAVRNDTTPGARWLYSGGGITIAQLAATDVTGEPFPALMKRLVLDPAGMTKSTYENPIPAARAGETASGHERPDTAVTGRWHVYPEMAAAGLWTTAPDLARWGIALMRAYRGEPGGILSPAMAREMLRPQVPLPRTGPGARAAGGWWALGVEVAGSGADFAFRHGGRDEGFVAAAEFYPERDVGLVILTNATNGIFLGEITRAFRRTFLP